MAARPGDTEDLSHLSHLNEAILLEELKVRYSKDKIYTYVGDILVAFNPFKPLPIYSQEFKKRYRNARQSQNLPHIFATADAAYRLMMLESGRGQCCVISGESGAGKTESAKLVVSQLMELSKTQSILEQKILEMNPLLEAFGNAKTVFNNNSSRFGKYLQLKFNNGHVTGAKINEYLLEKSRVVSQNPQERNFHIFYYLISGMDPTRKEELSLTDPRDFQYLQNGGCHVLDSGEMNHFGEVCNALDLLGFEAGMQDNIFMCLAAVLHVGNIKFLEDKNEYSLVLEPRSGPIQIVSELLGIDTPHLVDVLTTSVSYARGEAIRRHLNRQGSIAARDALAKAIYDRMFRWIINRINHLLAPTASEMIGEREINILDIFGFENFEKNSFEQMCINVANEQLQHFFIKHIFVLEKEEYKKESLGSLDIRYHDNKPLLELFLSRPLGLYALLDEQCSFPRANDKTFVVKLCQILKKKKTSLFLPSKDTTSTSFSIIHYAGKVEYCSDGFLDKNQDRMPSGAIELLRASTNDLIKLIFTANISKTGTLALNKLTTGRLKKKGKDSRRGVPVPASRPPTVGAQFKNSLSVLTEKMDMTNPHFIHCFKPNTRKAPGNFDTETVITQLQYTGMLETVRIRREGYPFRPSFEEFLDKYGPLETPNKEHTSAENCRKILQRAGVVPAECKVGKNKIFLKFMHLEKLDDELERHHKAVTSLQKVIRGFIERCKFRGLLALKREQETKVTEFLLGILSSGEEVILHQLNLCDLDEEENPNPSAPPLEFITPSSAPPLSAPSFSALLSSAPPLSAPPFSALLSSAPPLSAPSFSALLSSAPPLSAPPFSAPSAPSFSELNYRTLNHPLAKLHLKPLPPPPDISAPPPEPILSDLEQDDEVMEVAISLEEEVFIAPARNSWLKTFGREGTKTASVRWFKETQAHLLRSSDGSFPDWFHGKITRRESEKLLNHKPKGTFLIRVCENRFGFSLSVTTCKLGSHDRDVCSVVHHIISQLETGKYVVVGESRVHSSLKGLLIFHSKTPIKKYGVLLVSPCTTQVSNSSESDDVISLETPPTITSLASGSNRRILSESLSCDLGSRVGEVQRGCGPSEGRRRKIKLSRTRSHDPKLGYGMLSHH